MAGKIALAFSGGLDTAFCVKYLKDEQDFEVHTIHVNTGGFSAEETAGIRDKAYSLGAAHHSSIDISDRYYNDCIRFLVFGNMLRNRNYPMSVSSERSFQAMAVADYAREKGIGAVAHGSTGAGNDQVRFDLVFRIMLPGARIIAPIRDLRLTRKYEMEYLRGKGVPIDEKSHKYSINKGLWGTSVGGQETLGSASGLPEEAWNSHLSENEPREISMDFVKGEVSGGLSMIRELDETGSAFAIGRDIHVGDTIIGIKGRVGFEAPAPMMIISAHRVLEKHVLTKWQIYWKDQLSEWYGMMLHEGMYLDPVMRNIEKFLADAQEKVSGKVFLKLRPYSFEVTGVESEFDLMSASGAKYGEENPDWTGEDVTGFTKILGNSLKTYHNVNRTNHQK